MNTNTNQKKQIYDAIIIGGGIAGSCTAIRLAQMFDSAAATWRRILVIDERTTEGTFKIGESLPGEAKPILKSMGVFEALNNDAMQGIVVLYNNLTAIQKCFH